MPKYTKENLEPIVNESSSWADVCRKVGIQPATGAQTHLARRANSLGIDCSHFKGKAWNKGRELKKKHSLEEYYAGTFITSHKLKLRLIKEGVKEAKCEICGLTEWQGQPIVLELDHKNSQHEDNRLDNLQIVCPNCHAMITRQRKAVVAERQTRVA